MLTFHSSKAERFSLKPEIHGSKFQSKIDYSLYCQHANSLNCYFLLFHNYPGFICFSYCEAGVAGSLRFLVHHTDGGKCPQSYLSGAYIKELLTGPMGAQQRESVLPGSA